MLDLIILDLGANDGCSILKFRNLLKGKKITNYRIISFEGNPYFYDHLKSLADEKTTIYNCLAGINNEESRLYLSQEGDDGSSIYADKESNLVCKDIYFDCKNIDIAKFIKDLPCHKELWIKMDIEGGEYKIIPHLKTQHCLEMIDKLFIEWHYHKIKSITDTEHNAVYAMVSDIEKENWNSLDYKRISRTDPKYHDFIRLVKSQALFEKK